MSGQPIRPSAINCVTEAQFHCWRKRLAPAPAKLIALPFLGGHDEQVLVVETPGYVIRLRGQAQVDWLGSVVMALR